MLNNSKGSDRFSCRPTDQSIKHSFRNISPWQQPRNGKNKKVVRKAVVPIIVLT